MKNNIVICLLLPVWCFSPVTDAFVHPPSGVASSCSNVPSTTSALFMAKAKTKKKKSTSSSGGLKGFASSKSSAKATTAEGTIDRSNAALKFYNYLERNGAAANLKRVGLGYFPLQIGPTDIQLRGVIALRDIPKGEAIIEIPYEMAIDLGRENSDPTLPATSLLQKYVIVTVLLLTKKEVTTLLCFRSICPMTASVQLISFLDNVSSTIKGLCSISSALSEKKSVEPRQSSDIYSGSIAK